MIPHRVVGFRFARVLATAGIALVLFLAWSAIFFHGIRGDTFQVDRYVLYSIFVGFAVLVDFWIFGWPHTLSPAEGESASASKIALRQTGFVLLSLTFLLYAAKDQTLSRLFLLTLAPILGGTFYLCYKKLGRLLSSLFFRGGNRLKAIVVGHSQLLAAKAKWLEDRAEQGIDFVGFVSMDSGGAGRADKVPTLPKLGEAADLDVILAAQRPSLVLFVDFPGDGDELLRRKILCDRVGARVLTVWSFHSELSHVPSIHREDGEFLLSLRNEPLESPLNKALKRAFDIAIALPVVALILPPLAVLFWIAHRFQSKGPLMYQQLRSGRNGEPFMILKFRSMHAWNRDEARQATLDDPRVFPFAKTLRRMNLDEFPQFINVLLGQMSVVGPRPHLPVHDEHFSSVSEHYRVRALIKPGITGLAQVKGLRGETKASEDILHRTNADLIYLENWSFLLDLHIVLRTMGQVLRPSASAY